MDPYQNRLQLGRLRLCPDIEIQAILALCTILRYEYAQYSRCLCSRPRVWWEVTISGRAITENQTLLDFSFRMENNTYGPYRSLSYDHRIEGKVIHNYLLLQSDRIVVLLVLQIEVVLLGESQKECLDTL